MTGPQEDTAPVSTPHQPEPAADDPSRDRKYAKAVGARLRAIRRQQGLSLHGVQEKSHGRWMPAAVGSYERGDRLISVANLAELAAFYGVPAAVLLPDGEPAAPRTVGSPVVLDLDKLAAGAEAADLVRAWAARIRRRRDDWAGRVLTIRVGDLDTLGLLYDLPADGIRDLLAEWGVLAAGRDARDGPEEA